MKKIGQGFKKQTTNNNFICIKMKNSVDTNVKAIIFILIIIISTICGSCTEELVEPPPPPSVEPDTVSRYVWSVYEVGNRLYGVYAADSNLVYINWGSFLIYWNGSSFPYYNLNDNNFYVTGVYGWGKDNLFVSGYKKINGLDLPVVKKINNGIISTIFLDSVETYIYDQLILGPDEAWFSSFTTNAVYHYTNGIVKKYNSYENDSIATGVFYINANKEIFLFQQAGLFDALNKNNKELTKKQLSEKQVSGSGTLYNFKFDNYHFNLISTQCYNPDDPNCFSILIYRCGNDALMLSNNEKLFYFNGNIWVNHSRFDSLDTYPMHVGGISKDSLAAFTINRGHLYTFNGIRWRYENNSPVISRPSLGRSNTEAKFGNIYFCHWSPLINEIGLFYVGRPNKNFINE